MFDDLHQLRDFLTGGVEPPDAGLDSIVTLASILLISLCIVAGFALAVWLFRGGLSRFILRRIR